MRNEGPVKGQRPEGNLAGRGCCLITDRIPVTVEQLCAILNSAHFGTIWRCISLGRDSSAGRRASRKRAAAVQTQGSDRRHHQGSEASFLLFEARREEARERSACTQAEPQEDS